jgi:cell wall-associated NlpC family hydrolase
MAGKGISGVAVTLATVGGIMVYFAINDIPFVDGLRSLAKGKVPTAPVIGAKKGVASAILGLANQSASQANAADSQIQGGVGGSTFGGTGSAIADDAHRYLGVPYKWGGADPSGFDCSGLVTWVLHHDLGYDLPSNTHTVTMQFLTWTGAKDVPRSQAVAGDLCCSTGHIGIAVDAQNMIHAPDVGDHVKIGPIQTGMVIRRVVATSPVFVNNENANQGRF